MNDSDGVEVNGDSDLKDVNHGVDVIGDSDVDNVSDIVVVGDEVSTSGYQGWMHMSIFVSKGSVYATFH